ncbi:MAG: hypothetical protein K2K02_01625 [Ruminococcus sp.]|nr:hypothetical protein [Ruminococcus sp.]
MKKLIALLVVCTMMTGAFASCGDDKQNESSAEKSISEAETKATESDTEEETTEKETSTEKTTKEKTTEEKTTTEKTTEETTTTQTTTEKTTTKSATTNKTTTTETTTKSADDDDSEESILGMWYIEDDDLTMGFDFKDKSNLSMWIDITDVVHFSGNDFIIDGDVLNPDSISYDGTTFSINVDGQDLWTMTKESGSTDSYDGEYKMVSGIMYDSVALYEGVDVYVIVKGDTMLADYRNALTYSVDEDKIAIIGLDTIDFNEKETLDTTYEIKDGTLTIKDFDEDGDCIMKRFDITTFKSENDNKITEENIIGAWRLSDDKYGLRFNENGTGNLFVDSTEMLQFADDGNFIISNTYFEPEEINYDGTTFSIDIDDTDMLTMTRNGDSNPDSFNGKYTIKSGAYYDGMIDSIGDSFGIESEDVVVYLIVDGEKTFVEFSGVFIYSVEKGSLVFEGLENIGISDGSLVPCKMSENGIILTGDNKEKRTFEKTDLQ